MKFEIVAGSVAEKEHGDYYGKGDSQYQQAEGKKSQVLGWWGKPTCSCCFAWFFAH